MGAAAAARSSSGADCSCASDSRRRQASAAAASRAAYIRGAPRCCCCCCCKATQVWASALVLSATASGHCLTYSQQSDRVDIQQASAADALRFIRLRCAPLLQPLLLLLPPPPLQVHHKARHELAAVQKTLPRFWLDGALTGHAFLQPYSSKSRQLVINGANA